ncbi:MAG: thiolase family protein [Deltaproteobacteria bacterium]|nr:thiolase family protein [Deltaproteobacteria bacterium]
MKFRNAVIVDGVRSPFSWGGRGMFEATRLDEVAAKVVRVLMERNPRVKPTMIEDFGVGNAGNTSDLVLLGGISRLAGLPAETTNFFSNRQCGSSMETMQRIAMSIMVGAMDCGISLGAKIFEKSKLQRDMAEDHFNYFSVPIPDEVLDGPPLQPMVQTAQNVVDMYDISREELDAFTVRSHQKLTAAYAAGIYKDEVIPMEVEKPVFNDKKEWVPEEKGEMVLFDRDECIRPGCNMEDLGKMNPVKGIISFCNKPLQITAGNSCPTNSGASAVLVMAEDLAIKMGLTPLARIVGMGVGGVKGQIMGMGPVPATIKAMKHAGITADQIDRVEFNEAFACQVVASLKELKIPEEKINVNGGSLGIGHPLGATGARLVLTVAKELRRSGKRYGLATQCIGAGEGISTIIEAMN